jgi:hypothetical protein
MPLSHTHDTQVLASEGIAALFIGLGPTIARNCVWNSIYYGTMHEVKSGLAVDLLDAGSWL